MTAGTRYVYKAYSDSSCSTELTSGITDVELLTKPVQVTGLRATTGDASLNMSWSPVTGTVTGYKVQWKSGDQNYDITRQNTVSSGTSNTITGLSNGTSYTLRVTAYNDSGDGETSSEVTQVADASTRLWDRAVSDQLFTVGTEVNITLPEASGTGSCTVASGYDLVRSGGGNTLPLPSGLSWDGATRSIRGTPTAVFSSATLSYRASFSSCAAISQDLRAPRKKAA